MALPAPDPTTVTLAEGDELTVDGVILRVRVSARRKRCALTVEADADVTLHVPEGHSAREAEDFVRAHLGWLTSRISLRKCAFPMSPAKRLIEGEVFRYLGRTYRLAISEQETSDGEIRLVAGRLVMSREQAEDVGQGRSALVDWYCRTGHDWVRRRLQPWAARLSVTEPEVDVCDLGNRWGRYRPDAQGAGPGRLSLGWPLLQLPMHLVDYVIAHELAHVRISGHGRDYWRSLKSALPECDERRSELDELGRRMWMGEITRFFR